jgi:hypothetical protein
VIGPRDKKEVGEGIWFALLRIAPKRTLVLLKRIERKREDRNKHTSSIAHFISFVSMVYIGGTTCTGILISRSHRTRPTCAWGFEKRDWSVAWNAELVRVFSRA